MIIEEIYNHRHRLKGVPFLVRAMYILPAFVISLLTNLWIFQLSVFIVYLLLILYITKIKTRRILRLFQIPFLFIFIGSITLLVSFNSSRPIYEVNNIALGIERDNLGFVIQIITKSVAIVSIVYFWLLTHTISEISQIMRSCKVPTFFIELFVLTYKLIFNLFQSAKALTIAQKCRLGYTKGTKPINAFALLFTAVFRLAMDKTQQIEVAIASRNGTISLSFLGEQTNYHKKQLVLPAFITLFIALTFFTLTIYV